MKTFINFTMKTMAGVLSWEQSYRDITHQIREIQYRRHMTHTNIGDIQQKIMMPASKRPQLFLK